MCLFWDCKPNRGKLCVLASLQGQRRCDVSSHGAFRTQGMGIVARLTKMGKLVMTLQQKSSPCLQLKPHFSALATQGTVVT
jgi:hypothetical protein